MMVMRNVYGAKLDVPCVFLFEFVGTNVFLVEFLGSFGTFEGFDPREGEKGREMEVTMGGRGGAARGRPGRGRRRRAWHEEGKVL
jgi:hypothetical protein